MKKITDEERLITAIFGILPKIGDYVQLEGENHTTVDSLQQVDTYGKMTIKDYQGEVFVVTRYPEKDTQERRAWKKI